MSREYPRQSVPPGFNYRGILLYLLPSPLVFKLLISILSLSFLKIFLSAGAIFFFYSAAHLTRSTLIELSTPHINPLKKVKDQRLLSMIYVGLGTLLLMFLLRRSIPATLLMIICSVVGYYLTYGLPKAKAQAINLDNMPKATRQAIQGAYQDIEKIEQLSQQLTQADDTEIVNKIKQVIIQSYRILDLLSDSPNDAGRARRFLNVYTNRIKEILEQYLNLAKYEKADAYRERLTHVLTETHKAFAEQESKLLDDDQFKLDVQLEVLDEQIKNEQKK